MVTQNIYYSKMQFYSETKQIVERNDNEIKKAYL